MKSKKMTKSTFAIIIMAIAMVAMLAFGGTYAYFTASSAAAGSNVTTGVVSVRVGANATITKTGAVTNTKVLDAVTINADQTTVKAYVFVTFDATITDYEGNTDTVTPDEMFGNENGFTPNTAWTKLTGVADVDNVWYQIVNNDADGAAAYDGSFLTDLTITASPSWDEAYDEDGVATDTQPETMGATIVINISAEAIQAFNNETDGDFATAADAYNALNA